jgi:hypothetical protein
VKIYLIAIDNGERYEKYSQSNRKAFTDYIKAAEWLVNHGYEPYIAYSNRQYWDIKSDKDLKVDFYGHSEFAEIVEIELDQKY